MPPATNWTLSPQDIASFFGFEGERTSIEPDSSTGQAIIHSSTVVRNETTSPILTTALTPHIPETDAMDQMLRPDFDDTDYGIPTLTIETDRYHLLERFLNETKVISDTPEYVGLSNTPLTAPELDLVNVDTDMNWTSANGMLGSAHTTELAWLIPAVVAAIFLLFLAAYACYYGVRALELKAMNCCFRVFGCCRPDGSGGTGEETDALTSSMAHHATEMKAYQSHSSPGGNGNFDL